jgi:hypothetical protein
MSIELINAWIINKLSKLKMEKFIDKLFTIKENLFKKENKNEKEIIYSL